MMRTRLLTFTLIFALTAGLGMLGFPGTGFCQPLQIKDYHGTPYVSGGIGLGERAALQKTAKDYNLKVTMAMKSGDYVADVEVTVENSAGKKVLQADAQGPWLYAKLPAGTYKVRADMSGQTRQRTVRIGSRSQSQVYFYW